MPRGDRTGPMGAGPMTGRGAGYCAGYDLPGYANPVPGRGFGAGWGGGGGRGWRHWYRATGLPRWARCGWDAAAMYGPPEPPTREQQAEALEGRAKWLEEQLAAIRQRIAELK